MKATKLFILIPLLAFACDSKPKRPTFGHSGDATPGGEDEDPSDGKLPTETDELKLAAPVVHRLNRNEYNNAILDVFGMDLQLAYDFPEDPVTHGFDNIGGNLSMSPALTDLISQAAQKIANKVVDDHPRADIDIDPSISGKGQTGAALGRQWSIEGTMNNKFTLENDESMTFSVLLGGEAYRVETPKAQIKLDNKLIGEYEIKAESNYPQSYEIKADLAKGEHNISITFMNQSIRDAVNPRFNYLILTRITGKSAVTVESKMTQDIKACAKAEDAEACKQKLYVDIAERAWRRPLTTEEKSDLKALWKATIESKGTESDAMRSVIYAITLSTKFLFRTTTPVAAGKGKAELDDYSIASRLSFFLWSSIPDKELLDAAAKKELRVGSNLKSQIKRMLADPKSHRFVKNFASQWLYTRPLDKAAPDPAVFPNFTAALKNSMALESELVFGDFITNGKDINDFLSPGFTYADDRLAKHYGLTPPGSNEPKKIMVSNNERGGILSHAAWLTVTSLPTDTMPVKRGVWIMENVLCRTVPAPPAVPPLEASSADKPETVRERFARHLKDPTCAGCHNLIDPIGFGLEGFDATGASRTMDSVGKPVDTKGSMFGTKYDDFNGMVKAIQEGHDFKDCFTKKLYSYALGRIAETEDDDNLKAIAKEMSSKGASLADIIEYIVLSPAFRMADFSEDL